MSENTNKYVFLFWHSSEEEMPLIHKMNLWNFRYRLQRSNWKVILTSLNKKAPSYIENYITLPKYFYDISNRISDHNGIYGNLSDIIRLRLLERYGGCYFDTSTIHLRDDIQKIHLYTKFALDPTIAIAGYSNVTFTRKTIQGKFFYPEARDGMELGVLFARKGTAFLKTFNEEIDLYWQWKTKEANYSDYPPFQQYNLASNSFLNEYHVHYAIYHMILAKYPQFVHQVITQSMHMRGKENAIMDGPYSIQDRFCRGNTAYAPASPQRLLKALLPFDMECFDGQNTKFERRIELFLEADLLVFPGYIRTEIEDYFRSPVDYFHPINAYSYFYPWLNNISDNEELLR